MKSFQLLMTRIRNRFVQQASLLASDEAMAQTAEAASQQDRPGRRLAEQMAVDEAKASKQAWVTDGAGLGVAIDAEGLADAALAVGRDSGGALSRLGAQFFGTDISVTPTFSASACRCVRSQNRCGHRQPHADYDITVSGGVAYAAWP